MRRFWRTYAFLVLFRVLICPFLPGYIHPDELHQSGEAVAGPLLGTSTVVPWEFAAAAPDQYTGWCSSGPHRSIVPPMATAGVGLSALGVLPALPAYATLVAPRVIAALQSLIIDVVVYTLGGSDALLAVASGALFAFAVQCFAARLVVTHSRNNNKRSTRNASVCCTTVFQFARSNSRCCCSVSSVAWRSSTFVIATCSRSSCISELFINRF